MAGSFIIGDSRTVGEAGTQGVKAKVTNKKTKAENLGGGVKHTNTARGLGNDGNYYYASGGQAYKWFSSAREDIVKEVKKSGADNIVIQLGVNDVGAYLKESDKNNPSKVKEVEDKGRVMARKYIKEALKLSEKTGKPIIFVSANPVEGDRFFAKKNKWLPQDTWFSPNVVIQAFNDELEKQTKANGMSFISTYEMVDEKLKKNHDLAWSDNIHYSAKLSKSVRKYVDNELAELNLVAQTKSKPSPELSAQQSDQTTTKRVKKETSKATAKKTTTTNTTTKSPSKPKLNFTVVDSNKIQTPNLTNVSEVKIANVFDNLSEADKYAQERKQLENLLYPKKDENIFQKIKTLFTGKETNNAFSPELVAYSKAKIESLKFFEEQARCRENLKNLEIFGKDGIAPITNKLRTPKMVKDEREHLEKYKKENKGKLSKDVEKNINKYIKSLKKEEKFRKKMEEKGFNKDLHKTLAEFARESQKILSEKEKLDNQNKEEQQVSVKTLEKTKPQIVLDEEKIMKNMNEWMNRIKISQEEMEAFIQKFGLENAYKLALTSLMEPVYLDKVIGRITDKASSKRTFKYLMTLDEEGIKNAIAYTDKRFKEEETWRVPVLSSEVTAEMKSSETTPTKVEEVTVNSAEKIEKEVTTQAVKTTTNVKDEKSQSVDVEVEVKTEARTETVEKITEIQTEDEIKKDMKEQSNKGEIKTVSAVAHIELENGKFTQRVKADVIAKLTPIYGEYAKDVYMSAMYPAYLDEALGIKRPKASSKALLEDLLTFEGENVQKVIEYVKANPIKTIHDRNENEETVDVEASETTKPITKETANSMSKTKYCTRGGYEYKMPQEVAALTMGLLYEVEYNRSNHYLCANGFLTNIGVTYTYNKSEYRKTFGGDICDLMYKAEKAVRNNKEIYYSLDGKTWKSTTKGSGTTGNFVMKNIQSKTRGGQTLYISSKPDGKGDLIQLKRIAGAGFIIEKVNGKVIPVPDMCVSENLNMRVMDTHYARVKKLVHPQNWENMSPKEKLYLAYSHYHNPSKSESRIRVSGLTKKLPIKRIRAASETAIINKKTISSKNIEKGHQATTVVKKTQIPQNVNTR